MLEVLCKEKGFDAKELFSSKSNKSEKIEEQCVELLEVWGEKKIHWWWPWSKKMKDIELDEKQLQRARNYKKYSFFWKIIFSLFTSILIHRRALKRDDLISYYTRGDSMPNANISYGKENGVSRSSETTMNLEKEKGASQGSGNLEHVGNIVPGGALVGYNIALDFLSLGSRRFDSCILSDATLGDALKLLNLPNLLENLDNDLEIVKRKEKNKAEHEKYFNQEVNDKFKKLSRKYHPDQIQKKGGSSEDVTRATEMQQGVNLVWKVLKMLHSNFINNNFLSNQDFKYSTCSKVEVSILSNEERLRSINNKVLIELCWLSRIKHEEIIPNLNEFLKLGQSSIQNFLSNDGSNFAQERRQALIYFKKYLSGYKYIDVISVCNKIVSKQKKQKNLVSSGLGWVGEKWNNFWQNPSVEEEGEVGISDQEVVDIAGRIADSASCYRKGVSENRRRSKQNKRRSEENSKTRRSCNKELEEGNQSMAKEMEES
ncbi:uncharacterized protein TNCT_445001 [Trichonephila clavata]|uniref:J domain-containing protein n=1 Tax=Trichonephila clavata TaxID=2740835 RepID=A0A8X6H1X9_TRICU|nr:uncharacterized protein TNCT_445001 [Trichonephila clavata]